MISQRGRGYTIVGRVIAGELMVLFISAVK